MTKVGESCTWFYIQWQNSKRFSSYHQEHHDGHGVIETPFKTANDPIKYPYIKRLHANTSISILPKQGHLSKDALWRAHKGDHFTMINYLIPSLYSRETTRAGITSGRNKQRWPVSSATKNRRDSTLTSGKPHGEIHKVNINKPVRNNQGFSLVTSMVWETLKRKTPQKVNFKHSTVHTWGDLLKTVI